MQAVSNQVCLKPYAHLCSFHILCRAVLLPLSMVVFFDCPRTHVLFVYCPRTCCPTVLLLPHALPLVCIGPHVFTTATWGMLGPSASTESGAHHLACASGTPKTAPIGRPSLPPTASVGTTAARMRALPALPYLQKAMWATRSPLLGAGKQNGRQCRWAVCEDERLH